MEPFDFVQLDNGDYACAMWWNKSFTAWAAFVFYSSQRIVKGAPDSKVGEKSYWKVLIDKNRENHDDYLITSLHRLVFRDPVGGIMLALNQSGIQKVLRAKRMLKDLVASQNTVVKQILELLDVDIVNAGVTGSTLVCEKLNPDFDLVVYGGVAGRVTAGRVRTLILHDWKCLLPGYWGRPHHRRFKFAGLEICPRFPLPSQILADFTGPSQVVKNIESAVLSIEDATWGHCSPALYFTKVKKGASNFMNCDSLLPLISSESAHSMAFREGDEILMRQVELRCAGSKFFISIPIGGFEKVRPYD